jgi:transaldolase
MKKLVSLEKRVEKSQDISNVHSVAYFFISRIDVEVDTQLGNQPDLKGLAAIANAIMAYEAYLEFEKGDRWQKLLAHGGRLQRPLWASTGVKDPSYDKTRYVMSLVAPNVINTMPEATLNAVKTSGKFEGNTINPNMNNNKRVSLLMAGLISVNGLNKCKHNKAMDTRKINSKYSFNMASFKDNSFSPLFFLTRIKCQTPQTTNNILLKNTHIIKLS